LGGNSSGRGGAEQYVTYQNETTGTNGWMVGMGDDENFHFDYRAVGEIDETNSFLRIDRFSGQVMVSSGLVVDNRDFNAGSLVPGLTFGNGSGEGIASKRTAGGNQYGLDLYTNSTARLSINQSGKIGIGTTAPAYLMQVSTSAGSMGTLLAVSTGSVDLFRVTGTSAALSVPLVFPDGTTQTTAAVSPVGLLKANTSIQGGDTISGNSSETNFATNYSMPASYCVQGRVLRITAQGTWSTNATGTNNPVLRVKLGSTVLGATTSSSVTNGLSSQFWRLEFEMICNAAPSASSAVEGQGQVIFYTDGINGFPRYMLNTATINVATNSSLTVQLSSQWNNTNAGNSFTLRQFILESLGP
jgi:hypothetical protein